MTVSCGPRLTSVDCDGHFGSSFLLKHVCCFFRTVWSRCLFLQIDGSKGMDQDRGRRGVDANCPRARSWPTLAKPTLAKPNLAKSSLICCVVSVAWVLVSRFRVGFDV